MSTNEPAKPAAAKPPRKRRGVYPAKPLLERMIETTEARTESDEFSTPPSICYVQFMRSELIAVLTPRANASKRAKALLWGVERARGECEMMVQREHLLVALGQLEEEGDENGVDQFQPGV